MTDLERRVNEALERLKASHAPTPQEPPQQQPKSYPPRHPVYTPPRREAPRPVTPPPSKVWGRNREGRDMEGRFADAPDATKGGTVRVFVFEVEPINGEPYATCVRQDNRQRIRVPIAALVNVRDNA